jgi:hypothetical protein
MRRQGLFFYYAFVLFVVLLLSLQSCAIDSFEPVIDLKPPLGLSLLIASNSTNIHVSFFGLNDEPYFEGYRIFIVPLSVSAWDPLNPVGFMVPNSDPNQSSTLPNEPKVSSAKMYSYDVAVYSNGQPFLTNANYFFYVMAYSAVYNIMSKPSNLTNIVYQTN